MVDFIEKSLERVGKLEYFVTISIFLVMIFLMLAQVITRYVFQYPLGWSEELIRFLFVISSFLGGAIATRERNHIEINVIEVMITNKYSDYKTRHKYAAIINIIRDSLVIICLIIVSTKTWDYVVDIYEMQSVSSALLLPMWTVIVFLFIGIILSLLHTISLFILNLNGRGPTGFKFDGGENS